MVKPKVIVIGLIAAAAAVFAYFHYFQTDEGKIRKQFARLAESGSKTEGESKIALMKRVGTIKSLFAETFELNTPWRPDMRPYGKPDLNTFALAVFSKYSELAVRFHDLAISIEENGNAANAVLTAELEGRVGGERVADFHELRCSLEKSDGDWLFSGIEFVDVLEK